MTYLNLGCGSHYSTQPGWTNLDFVSSGEGVIAHNLINGIPFTKDTFDLVYHSHVLEHFSKEEGNKFITECFRVLKPGEVIRIAVPDLEQITKNYLKCLERGNIKPGDKVNELNYEWIELEMYDQTVRKRAVGNMAQYLYRDTIPNENFVFERIGEEGRSIRNSYLGSKNKSLLNNNSDDLKKQSQPFFINLKKKLKNFLLKRWDIDENALAIGKFMLRGEIHQWMYDKYSLSILLKKAGAIDITVKDAFSGSVDNWERYNLGGKDLITRKPDSLFIEAKKN